MEKLQKKRNHIDKLPLPESMLILFEKVFSVMPNSRVSFYKLYSIA